MTSIVKKIEEIFTGTPHSSKIDSDMQEVLDALASLNPKPIENLTPEEARKQPTAADAAHVVMLKKGLDASSDMGIRAIEGTYDGATEKLPLRIYRPLSEEKELPIILYFHGGGWVIASIDTYDATPRAIAKQVNAVVVSVHYRQAPEHKFPAAHEDAFAAYRWVTQNASTFGGHPHRIAIMGESAGGNLALATAIKVRDSGAMLPKHVAAIYPVAGVDMNTESYIENANAKPLNKPMMNWFMKHVLASPSDKQDPRLDIIGKADLTGLPPVTIITAGHDPLRTDGEHLAEKLDAAGVNVNHENYPGATHEFFGMAAVVDAAKKAEAVVTKDLKKSLS